MLLGHNWLVKLNPEVKRGNMVYKMPKEIQDIALRYFV